jgi:hypothetical protein
MRIPFAALVVVVTCALATPAQAQFRNQGFQLPNVGWLGLGTWDRVLHGGQVAEQKLDTVGGQPEAGWNLWDQPTVGMGHFFAIGYDLWVESQAAIGVSTTVLDLQAKGTPVLTLAASGGLRYNFLSERVRPFVGFHLQYLQLILFASEATTPVPGNGFFGNFPFFIGARPSGGVEWIFGDEMSVMGEVGVIGFLVPDQNRGLGGLVLPASIVRLSYNVYF